MGIICGNKVRRRKRGVMEEVSSVNIEFDVNSIKLGENPKKDCPRICKSLRIPDRSCDTYCIPAYKRWVPILFKLLLQMFNNI